MVAGRRGAQRRREIDAGPDRLGDREQGHDAPRFKGLIDCYIEEYLPHLALTNASDQKSMLRKLVEPNWGNRLVAEITPSGVEKLLTRIAAGRPRPSKAKPNNCARKLQGSKPTPIRANRTGEVLHKMFTLAVGWKWRNDNPASRFRRRLEMNASTFCQKKKSASWPKRLMRPRISVPPAETTALVCFGIELNSTYVDVAVERWQQFSGEAAVLDGNGRSFDEIKAGRSLHGCFDPARFCTSPVIRDYPCP